MLSVDNNQVVATVGVVANFPAHFDPGADEFGVLAVVLMNDNAQINPALNGVEINLGGFSRNGFTDGDDVNF